MQPNRELYKDYVLKAAETRDPEALVEKARLLIKGEDLEPDPKMALDILTDLEENQMHAVPGMHFLLGYLHEEGLGTPAGYGPGLSVLTSRGRNRTTPSA